VFRQRKFKLVESVEFNLITISIFFQSKFYSKTSDFKYKGVMEKTKFELEYYLKSPSLSSVWIAVGTPAGMAEWFADDVRAETEKKYIYVWDGHPQYANVIALKPYNYIRLQWEEDEGTDAYFELRFSINELTNDMMLHITDFAPAAEKNDAILLWNKQIDEMKRKNGL
jgi:uncharacterized protein YndB with AHSA1/START domain